jgi:hypothetical protein
MVNPFKHVGKVISDAYANANESDCAPGLAVAATTVGLLVVAPYSFVSAFFKKRELDDPNDPRGNNVAGTHLTQSQIDAAERGNLR